MYLNLNLYISALSNTPYLQDLAFLLTRRTTPKDPLPKERPE